MNEQRGSTWKKWDLHIHTPSSLLTNEFGNVWDEYVKRLFKKVIDKGICALGLTDYFTIDGYKKLLLDYLSQEEKMNSLFSEEEFEKIKKILIIPNIEFRINKLVGSSRINFHVILSEEIELRDIEENFLHQIHFVYEGTPQDTEEKRTLTLSNLGELGKKLKDEHSHFRSMSDIKVGMMNAVVDDAEIIKILDSQPSIFRGKYLVGVEADEDLSRINWDSQGHQTRKVLLQKSDFILTSNPSTRLWALGREPYADGQEAFIIEFKGLKPSLHGSDAHKYYEIGHPCILRGESGHNCVEDSEDCELKYCWIKADLTFEGLKQILYEPELRVDLRHDDPAEAETYTKIVDIKFNFPEDLSITEEQGEESEFCISGTYNFDFSNNLTCIIGGRGSGKSSIVHIIYNAWVNGNPGRLREIDSPLLYLTLDNPIYEEIRKLTDVEVPINTEFFFQNEIEKSAKNVDTISSLITQRLNLLSQVDSRKGLITIRDEWRSNYDSLSNVIIAYESIVDTSKKIDGLTNQIRTIRKQTEVITSDTYKSYQNDIESITNRVREFDDYKNEYQKVIGGIDQLIEIINEVKWDDNSGGKEIGELNSYIVDQRSKIIKRFSAVESEFQKQNFPIQLEKKKSSLKQFLEEKGLSDENIEELADANELISKYESAIKTYNYNNKPHEELFSNKDSVINSLKSIYTEYRTRYEEVISLLEKRLEGLEISNQRIDFSLYINSELIIENVISYIKNYIKENIAESARSDYIYSILFEKVDLSDFIDDKEKIFSHVQKYEGRAETHCRWLKDLLGDNAFRERLHLELIKYYYDIENIRVQIKLGNKLLQNTSFGERCGIVVTIIIIAGTNPIIIDQPEDNLDGRFITEVLVPIIRQQKRNRQIVLVTRDANIVIGGDSELIHILEAENHRSKVLPSTIEDLGNRSKYIWILDGGKEAFRKREKNTT